LEAFLQYRKWPEHVKASLLQDIDDIKQKKAHAVDPTRVYGLIYKKGELIGGSCKPGQLELQFARQLDNTYCCCFTLMFFHISSLMVQHIL